MLTFIIVLLIVGLIAGAIARLLVPGRDAIGIPGAVTQLPVTPQGLKQLLNGRR